MKNQNTLILLLVLFAVNITLAQDFPGQTEDGNVNILDAGVASLATVFTGDSLMGNKGSETTYLDLLKMSTLPPEEKKRYEAFYLFYAKSLEPKSKDSLEQVMIQQLKERLPNDSLQKKANNPK